MTQLMALEAPALGRVLFPTKYPPPKKKGGGRKTVQIHGHFRLLLALTLTLTLRRNTGGGALQPARLLKKGTLGQKLHF